MIVESFEHFGFRCEIAQSEGRPALGILPWHCGYVTVPLGHPWHGGDYMRLPLVGLDVHGGITYSDTAHTGPGWTVGFDTNHFADGPYERSLEYCREQTLKLAEQAFQAQQARSGVLERQDWFLTMNEGETR